MLQPPKMYLNLEDEVLLFILKKFSHNIEQSSLCYIVGILLLVSACFTIVIIS